MIYICIDSIRRRSEATNVKFVSRGGNVICSENDILQSVIQ